MANFAEVADFTKANHSRIRELDYVCDVRVFHSAFAAGFKGKP